MGIGLYDHVYAFEQDHVTHVKGMCNRDGSGTRFEISTGFYVNVLFYFLREYILDEHTEAWPNVTRAGKFGYLR